MGVHARVILVSHDCVWYESAVSLVLPTFDDTGSLGSPPRRVVYPHASRLLAENREAELKSTTFSSLLFFHVFLYFLFQLWQQWIELCFPTGNSNLITLSLNSTSISPLSQIG